MAKRPREHRSGPPDPAPSAPSGAAPDDARPSSRARVWLTAVALAVLTLAVYAPVRGHEFVGIDDPDYLTRNPHVAAGLTPSSVVWAFQSTHAANWHPVTWLSHMLDVTLFGMNPGAHHVTNLVLHVANAVLLLVVLWTMTRALAPSAFVAALFALHPLHVESVAWVAERKDVLSTLLALATIAAYVRYTHIPSRGRFGVVMVLFALGLMAKPMLVTLPVVFLLLDWWPLRRVPGSQGPRVPRSDGGRAFRPGEAADLKVRPTYLRVLREKLPLVGLAIASSVVTIVAQQRGGAVGSFDAYPLAARLGNALVTYAEYLARMVWPVRLAAFYPYDASPPIWELVASALVLVAVSIVAVRAARRHPYLLVGWLWYLVTLVPVIGVIQVGSQASADRYTYVPLIGVFIAIAWGGLALVARWPAARVPVAAAAILALGGSSVMARAQAVSWHDDVALWTRAVRSTNHLNNHSTHYALGAALRARGDLDRAIAHLRESVRREPVFTAARYELGLALLDRGETAEALQHFEAAVRLDPGHVRAHRGAAEALMRLREPAPAADHLSEVLRLEPANALIHHKLGLVLVALGRMGEAQRRLTEAVRLDPASAEARVDLGSALAQLGRDADAMAQYVEARRLKPDLADVHHGIGSLLARQGRLAEAATAFAEAVRMRPSFELARLNLGLALAATGRRAEAIRELNEVLRLHPGNQTARQALASLERVR
jgi:tetratricopeptide (TPR) repeat protein